MNTQPQYIQIALLIGLGLLVLITCIGSYMLYTMEYDAAPVQVTGVSQGENTPVQNEVTPPTDGTMPAVQEGVEVPPPPPLPEGVPTLEEMEVRWAEHEAELKAAKENPSTPVMDFITQEEIQRRAQELQNTPPTTLQ